MAKLAVRATGAYARVRSQFKTPIGKFEGVEEALTRMGGNLYMMDATRVLTALAVDLGEKPAVLSGIAKYHLTERARKVVIDGMDIAGGKGVCMGPSNFLGAAYMQLPVSITVEGANILTRSLIIFGQGAIRCHPFVLREIAAANDADRTRASTAFDLALFGHIGFVLSNMARTFVMGLCGSHCARAAHRRRARNAPLLPAADALLGGAGVSRRHVDGRPRRRAQAQGKIVGAAWRRAVDALSLLGHAQALRGRRPAGRRRAADALGDLGRDVPGAERASRA